MTQNFGGTMSKLPQTTMQATEQSRLPIAALLALAMTGFICIFTETIPAGLLPQIAQGLNVSESVAGQLITSYALGSLIAAIPLTILTAKWPRRHVLLFTAIGFLIFNTITALSQHIILTLIVRFFAGAAAGLAWSLLAGYARRMVRPEQQGKAMAIAMIGTPIALSLGVPAGTWLGQLIGWKMSFLIMSILTIILIFWILIAVPNYPGQSHQKQQSIMSVLKTPGVFVVLSVVFTWMLAHNILYTYITPFLTLSNLQSNVGIVLLIFGLMALIGIWFTGRTIDHHLRKLVLVSLFAFSLLSLCLGLWSNINWIVFISIGLWGLTFGGAATLLQTALADAAGHGADVALSLNVVVWNSAIAGSGILGGILLTELGAKSFPWIMCIILICCYLIAYFSKNAGFVQMRHN